MPAKLTTRRLAAIEAGAMPYESELPELARLARIGQDTEKAIEVVVMGQGVTGGPQGVSHTWKVDTGFDEDPAVAKLLGMRVRVIPVERVLQGYAKGSGWPKDPATLGLAHGATPPRNWRSPAQG